MEVYAKDTVEALGELRRQLRDVGVRSFTILNIKEPNPRVLIAHEDIILN